MDAKTPPPTTAVLRRLDGLERSYRRLKLSCLAATCALAGIAWTSTGEPGATAADTPAAAPTKPSAGRVVTATRFVVVDEHGHEAVELSEHHISFYDDAGKVRVKLGAFALGKCSAADGERAAADGEQSYLAALEFIDDNGRPRAVFNSNPTGWSTIAFFGDDGAGCANLNVSDDCHSGLAIGNDKLGFGRFWTDESGQVNIDILGSDQKVRWTTR